MHSLGPREFDLLYISEGTTTWLLTLMKRIVDISACRAVTVFEVRGHSKLGPCLLLTICSFLILLAIVFRQESDTDRIIQLIC
jgi:hypothetical protein